MRQAKPCKLSFDVGHRDYPASCMVGRSGNSAMRSVEVTASARSAPDFKCGLAVAQSIRLIETPIKAAVDFETRKELSGAPRSYTRDGSEIVAAGTGSAGRTAPHSFRR